MARDVEYEPLSVEDVAIGDHRSTVLSKLTIRRSTRFYIGRLLFIGLGSYFIWKTVVNLLSPIPQAQAQRPHLWRDSRYLFVL